MMRGLLSGIEAGWGAVAGWVAGIGSRAIGAIGNAGGWLYNIGVQMIQGMINGIRSMAGSLIGAVTSMIPGPIKKFLHIGSPSRLMATEVGVPIALGIAQGIEQGGGAVGAAMRGIIPIGADIGPFGASGAATGARAGPAVNVENLTLSDNLDVEAFMKQAAWVVQTQRI